MPESGKPDLIMEYIHAQRPEKNKVGREINHEDIPNTFPVGELKYTETKLVLARTGCSASLLISLADLVK